MIELGNRPVDITIRIQQGTSASWSFEFYESEAEDAVPVDPSTFVDVRMDLYNAVGAKVLGFWLSTGEGFQILTSAETGRKVLVLDKDYTESNLPTGQYRGDMLIIRNIEDADKPLNVLFIYEKTFTSWTT